MTLEEFVTQNNKTHIIFDFDETIVKLILPWENAMRRIKSDLKQLDPKIINDYYDNKISYSKLQNLYVEKYGDEAMKLILNNNPAFETEDLEGYLKNDRIINFIKNSNLKLFIWSSNTKLVITKILKDQNILGKFQVIVTRDDVKFLKPLTDGFQLIYDKKTNKENYLFVGDSSSDKGAADSISIDYYMEDYFHTPEKYW